jgi:8-oxo-dGTP pyrophosphatase MutT (NUDIX family)/phosphohistidine phosphatase SixA
MTEPALVAAAGAVVLRRESGRTQVLVVHRPKYDDWSFPKGKLDPEEAARTAAVREVLEETGVHIRLGPPLADQAYLFGPGQDRTKVVHYWVGRARGEHDVTSYVPNEEIDDVRWVDVDDAEGLLSYSRDRDTLIEAVPFARRTHPLIVVRHAHAQDRKTWKGDDRERTLTPFGEHQAGLLPPVLEAYGVERLVSSSSRRCWTTLAPYALATEKEIEVTDALSEEEATEGRVTDEVDWLVDLGEAIALCSHRPVLPLVFDALMIDPPSLPTAGAVVVHHRQGRIVALERIAAPSGSGSDLSR